MLAGERWTSGLGLRRVRRLQRYLEAPGRAENRRRAHLGRACASLLLIIIIIIIASTRLLIYLST